MKKKEISKEDLYKFYIEQNMTIEEVAVKLGRSTAFITVNIRKNNFQKHKFKIKKRNRGKYDYITKEKLTEQYVNNNKSKKEVAKFFNTSVDTITRKIRKFGLIGYRDRKKQLINKIFGKLKVIERLEERHRSGSVLWLCQCDCGELTKVVTAKLNNKHTSSCGNQICKSYNRTGYEKITGSYWCSIKVGARARNIDFNLDIKEAWNQFIKQGGICILSGLPIEFSVHFYKDRQTASLDRIDSKKGYSKDNIQWVHKLINRLKGNLEDKELIKLCGLVWENSRNRLEDNICV